MKDEHTRPALRYGPKEHECATCATTHSPDEPHNGNSLYYLVTFYQDYDRYPTWVDAMAHCSEITRARWWLELAHFRIYPPAHGT